MDIERTTEKFKGFIRQAEEVKKLSNATKIELLEKYRVIADRYYESISDSSIKNNLDAYKTITHPIIYMMLVCERNSAYHNDLKVQYKNLARLFNGGVMEVKKAIESEVGEPNDIAITSQVIIDALNSMSSDRQEEEGDFISLGDIAEELEEEAVENDDDYFLEMGEDESDGSNSEDEGFITFDGDEEENEKSVEDVKEAMEETSEANEVVEKVDTGKVYDDIASIFGGEIEEEINALSRVFDELYRSGYEGMAQAGILVIPASGTGAICYVNSKGEPATVKDKYLSMDFKIADAVRALIPSSMQFIDTPIEDSVDLILSNPDVVCRRFHLQIQSANIRFCTGDVSISRWITENKLGNKFKDSEEWLKEHNGNTVSLKKYRDVAEWTKWALRNVMYKALINAGIKGDIADAYKVTSIVKAIGRALRNVVVVSDRKIGVSTEIRISSSKAIDPSYIRDRLEKSLNSPGSHEIEVTRTESSRISTYRVVYDKAKESRSVKFAYEVIDGIIKNSTPPSWSHALLGQKEDGSYMYWDDFMDPSKASPYKRCYSIYAESRSGKGIMTSTLVASALCDNKQIFYTDGKPENGACLGEIAWSRGKEAYAFNGTAVCDLPYNGSLEKWTHGMRKEGEQLDFAKGLPKGLFESNAFSSQKQEEFLGITRYLKSLYLCARNMEERASGRVGTDKWQIWIFDEVTKMADIEMEIRHLMYAYLKSKGIDVPKRTNKTHGECAYAPPTRGEKLNKFIDKSSENYDDSVEYIVNWLEWASEIISYFLTAANISLGKSDVNLIFIFQSASWIEADNEITTLARVIGMIKSTKIVGNNGIADHCKEYGDGIVINTPWAKKINSGTGWWAISSASNIAKDNNVTVFKPYSVYTTKYDENTVRVMEPFKSEEESLMYMDGYVQKLLGNYGLRAEDILYEAYQYADNLVKTLDLHTDLKSYLYDATKIGKIDLHNKLEDLPNNSKERSGGADNLLSESLKAEGGNSDISIKPKDDFEDLDLFGPDTDEEQGEFEGEAVNRQGENSENIGAEPEKFKPITKKVDDTERIGVYSCKRTMTFDESKQKLVILRVKADMKRLFNVYDRDSNKVYGLRHLCWNCSIIWKFKVDVGVINSTIAGFVNSYLEYLDNGADLDFIPNEELVESMDTSGIRKSVELNIDKKGEVLTDNGEVQFKGVAPVAIEEYPADLINTQNRFPLNKLKVKSFESKYGVSYEMKQRSDMLIEAIVRAFRGKKLVNRIYISGNVLKVNDRLVNVEGLIDETYGIRFSDVVLVDEMLKAFPMVKIITLDCDMVEQLTGLMGYGWVDTLFKKYKILRSINAQFTYGGQFKIITRDNYNDNEDIKRDMEVNKLASKIEVAAATNNKRIKSKGVGYSKSVMDVAKHLGGNVKKNLMSSENPKVFSAMFNGVLAIAALGVAVPLGLFGTIFKMSKR